MYCTETHKEHVTLMTQVGSILSGTEILFVTLHIRTSRTITATERTCTMSRPLKTLCTIRDPLQEEKKNLIRPTRVLDTCEQGGECNPIPKWLKGGSKGSINSLITGT